MQITAWYDRTSNALYRGGFADVWKGKHCSLDVAVKVIRTYTTSDLRKIIGVSYWLRISQDIGELTGLGTEVLQRSGDMEDLSASERAATNGRDYDRDPVRHGIGVDGEREHQ